MSSKKESIVRIAIQKQAEYIRNRNRDFKITKKVVQAFDESSFPVDTQLWVDSYSVQITIPWGAENLRKVRNAIGKGWNFSYKSDSSDGSINYSYYMNIPLGTVDERGNTETTYVNLNITMSAHKLPEGACRKILVSEEEKIYTVQKYKIVCADGTMEEQIKESEMIA